jgi:hypothetical protein
MTSSKATIAGATSNCVARVRALARVQLQGLSELEDKREYKQSKDPQPQGAQVVTGQGPVPCPLSHVYGMGRAGSFELRSWYVYFWHLFWSCVGLGY